MSDDLNLDDVSTSSPHREIVRFKVKEGTSLYRILPPFGKDHSNKPAKEIRLHWGFYGADGKTTRPFLCIYDKDNGVSCPLCMHAKSFYTQAEAAKLDGNIELAKSLEKEYSNKKAKKSVLLNAADRSGTVGALEITSTTWDQLKDNMKKCITRYSKNPTSLTDGNWFTFKREGKMYDTTYTVSLSTVYDKESDSEKVDRTPLASNIIENYPKLAYDIFSMYKPNTTEELQRIANGEPFDTVIQKAAPKAKVEAAPAAVSNEFHDDEDEVPFDTTPAPAPKAAAKPAPKAAKAPAPEVADDDWLSGLEGL